MHVNELDVRQLLELLSRRSGLNILVSPKVAGTITANFEGTTVDAVLKAVIKLANLTEKTEGPIHYLYTKGELDEDAEFLKREKIITRVVQAQLRALGRGPDHDPAVLERRGRPQASFGHAFVPFRDRRVGDVRLRWRARAGPVAAVQAPRTRAVQPTRERPVVDRRKAATNLRQAAIRCRTATF